MSTPGELAARLRRIAPHLGEYNAADLTEAADHLYRIESLAARAQSLEAQVARLIEAWPHHSGGCIYHDPNDGKFYGGDDSRMNVSGGNRGYPTLAAAVRAKAGLEPEGGET